MRSTWVALFVLSNVGCGASTYQAGHGVRFDVDGTGRELDDSDVAKAFEAAPQMRTKSRVAYFVFDDDNAPDVEKTIASVPNVESVYRIPNLLVTGQRKYAEVNYSAPQEISVKKLRLLSARAHADVLVVFDHGYRGGGVNGWAGLNILLVPMFFTPWLSNETESYVQAHVIDVRNGYVYGEVQSEAKGGRGAVTIYGDRVDEIARRQWPVLLDELKIKLGEKMKPL